MRDKLSITIEESNLEFNLLYTIKSINNCFNRIADIIYRDSKKLSVRRYITAIAGPPGCGKSSIAHLIVHLLKINFQTKAIILPLDGFHYKNEYLKSKKIEVKSRILNLYNIKGAPETYNIDFFRISLEKLLNGEEFYWPIYSRKIHNPIDKGIKIPKNNSIYIIEGNYLLLDEPPWNEFTINYNKKIFISSSKIFLKKRVIDRKIAGGYPKREALKHYILSDKQNIIRVLNNSTGYDILLKQKGKYHYKIVKIFD